jgi:hypothetical protein
MWNFESPPIHTEVACWVMLRELGDRFGVAKLKKVLVLPLHIAKR